MAGLAIQWTGFGNPYAKQALHCLYSAGVCVGSKGGGGHIGFGNVRMSLGMPTKKYTQTLQPFEFITFRKVGGMLELDEYFINQTSGNQERTYKRNKGNKYKRKWYLKVHMVTYKNIGTRLPNPIAFA
jgi:hypothetical protein